MLDRPLVVRPLGRQNVVKYFEANPVKPHIPLGKGERRLIELYKGESTPSSMKQIDDLESIVMRDLLYPKRHIGESSRLCLARLTPL